EVSAKLVQRSGLPSVAWFMDDYYRDLSSLAFAEQIWRHSTRRFVISEAMQHYFSASFGGECGILNNSVSFAGGFQEAKVGTASRIRIVYTGALHWYYLDSMRSTLRELEGLGDSVTLDIYSHEQIPDDFYMMTDVRWR